MVNSDLPSINSSAVDSSIVFIVDSGASDHIVNDDMYFNGGAVVLRNPINIAVAKENETLSATKIGTILTTKGKLCNVLFVPNLRHNLFSVKRMENNGFGVKLDKGKFLFTKMVKHT